MLEGPFATGKEIPRTSSGGRDRSFSRARRGSERHQAGAAGPRRAASGLQRRLAAAAGVEEAAVVLTWRGSEL